MRDWYEVGYRNALVAAASDDKPDASDKEAVAAWYKGVLQGQAERTGEYDRRLRQVPDDFVKNLKKP